MRATKSLDETVREQLQASPAFRKELLQEIVEQMISGDFETGTSLLRRYVNGTLGVAALGSALGRSHTEVESLLDPFGKAYAADLVAVLAYLQRVEGSHFGVHERIAA